MTKTIIINGDDFGASETISKSIISFIQSGYCDTTPVMVNMDDYQQTLHMAKADGIVDRVGLHLNLTKGIPITNEMKSITTFCKNGVFGEYKRNIGKRFILNKREQNIVSLEIRAQMERYLECGSRSMCLDSHQGIHMDWSLYPIVIRLCEEYGFRKIRRSPNLRNDIKRKMLRAPYDKALMQSSAISTTNFMGSLKDYSLAKENIKSNRSVEIMTHPHVKNGKAYVDLESNLLLDDFINLLKEERINAWKRGN